MLITSLARYRILSGNNCTYSFKGIAPLFSSGAAEKSEVIVIPHYFHITYVFSLKILGSFFYT